METDNNIGQIFREAFDDFERKPSDKVWNNIEARAKAPLAQNKLMRNGKTIIISAASVLIISVIAFYFLKPTTATTDLNKATAINNTASLTQNTQNTTQNTNNNSTQTSSINTNPINNTKNNVIASANAKDSIMNVSTQKQNTTIVKQNDNIVEKTNANTANTSLNTTTITATQKINNTYSQNQNTTTSQKTQPNKNYAANANNTSEPAPISFSSDQTICKGDKIKLEVKGGSTYLWSTGERLQYIYVNPSRSTDYSVIVTDSRGQVKSGLISVTVNDCETLYVPNAFAPNGEGKASIFKAYGNNVRSFEMLVYSRAGQLVFSSKNIEESWNGTFNGNAAPMGVYVYRISYIDQLNNPHTINGHVSLIR